MRRKVTAYEKRIGREKFNDEVLAYCAGQDCKCPITRGQGGWVTLASGATLCGRCYLRRFSTNGADKCLSSKQSGASARS